MTAELIANVPHAAEPWMVPSNEALSPVNRSAVIARAPLLPARSSVRTRWC